VDWIDWGDAPTWVGAAFAAAAAWAAYKTLRSQQKQIKEQQDFIERQQEVLSLERAELLAVAEDRKRAQAAQIRMEPHKSGGRDDGMGGFEGYDHWFVLVRNDSDAPVRDVLVRFGEAYNASRATDFDGNPWSVPVPLLGAERVAFFYSSRWPEASVDNNRPHVYFTDEAGVRWHLDEHGALEEVVEAG